MKWTDLVTAVRDRSGASALETRAVLDALVDVSIEALVNGEEIVVPGFIKLSPQWQPPRTVRSVRGQRRLSLDGRYVARLKAGSRLKSALAERTPQRWRDPEHQKAWRLAEALLGDLELYHADDVPRLAPDDDHDVVLAKCAAAFGPAWQQVQQTFDAKLPAEVREATPHLAHAARRRWST